jgi:hypothetical protein
MPHHHGQQPRGAHLHGLLHHVIEPRPLERGKQVMQIAVRGLRPHLRLDHYGHLSLVGSGKTRFPFAVPPVKYKQRGAGLEAQYAGEIMRLGGIQHDGCARTERSGDKQSRAAKIVARHEICTPRPGFRH